MQTLFLDFHISHRIDHLLSKNAPGTVSILKIHLHVVFWENEGVNGCQIAGRGVRPWSIGIQSYRFGHHFTDERLEYCAYCKRKDTTDIRIHYEQLLSHTSNAAYCKCADCKRISFSSITVSCEMQLVLTTLCEKSTEVSGRRKVFLGTLMRYTRPPTENPIWLTENCLATWYEVVVDRNEAKDNNARKTSVPSSLSSSSVSSIPVYT